LDYIFYTEVAGAENDVPLQRFRLLITGWACEKGNPKDPGRDIVITKRIEAEDKHQDVTVLMLDENHKPISNAMFGYTLSQGNIYRDFETDKQGKYKIGPCLVNTTFSCEYKLTGQKRSFEVLKNIPLYELQFSPFVNAIVKVENQHEEPQPNINLIVSYGNQNITAVTDGLGCVILHDLLYQGTNVLMHIVAHSTENSVSEDVRVENSTSENHYTLTITTQDPMEVSLQVLLDGQLAPNYNVRIDCAGNTAIYATDEHGLIPLQFLKDKDVFNATSSQDEQQTQQFEVEYGKNLYVFNVQSPKKPAPIAPIPTTHRVLVVKNAVGNVIPLFTVRLAYQGQCKDFQTDKNGKIVLPEDWNVGEKFNVTPISDIPACDKVETHTIGGIDKKNDADGNNDIMIEEDKDEYYFVVPDAEPKPTLLSRHILVCDAEDTPKPFYTLQLKYNEQPWGGGEATSDKVGCIPLPSEWEEGEWFEAYDEKSETRQRYQLNNEEEYIFSRSLISTLQRQNWSFGDKKPFGHAVGQDANEGQKSLDELLHQLFQVPCRGREHGVDGGGHASPQEVVLHPVVCL